MWYDLRPVLSHGVERPTVYSMSIRRGPGVAIRTRTPRTGARMPRIVASQATGPSGAAWERRSATASAQSPSTEDRAFD